MIGAVLVVFLQVAVPQAAPVAEQTPAVATQDTPQAQVIPAGQMECNYDRSTRVRNCITSEGEELRCRRERQLGTRFYTWVCFTHAENENIEEETREQMDRQQRITTPDVR